MKEMIIKAFRALGLELEVLDELVYGFDYEGARYLWLANVDDDMLSICLPGIMDRDDSSELEFYQLMDRVNGCFKFVKANAVGDSVWLFYEHELLGEEDFERLIPHMILNLEQAYRRICEAASEEDAEPENEEAGVQGTAAGDAAGEGPIWGGRSDQYMGRTKEESHNCLIYDMPD